MMIIHILVDTLHVEPQDKTSTYELEYFQVQQTNIFIFTFTRSEYFNTKIKYLNHINYIFHELLFMLQL